MKIQLLLALLFVCVAGAFAFTCSSCDLSRCREVKCRFGVTKDECDCCPRCYKGIGESCGGQWHQHGRCAPSLSCIRIPVGGRGTTTPIPDEFNAGRCLALP